jgi:DNA-binding response OmpR family regulator
VDTYNDPVKALLAFKPGYYDLIVLEYRMVPLDGLAFIQKIRALDRLAKAILVLHGKHNILEMRSENGS